MSANTIDDISYSLMLGDAVSGSVMDNPRRVYAFYDDFTSPALKKDWVKNNYGKWIVQMDGCLAIPWLLREEIM